MNGEADGSQWFGVAKILGNFDHRKCIPQWDKESLARGNPILAGFGLGSGCIMILRASYPVGISAYFARGSKFFRCRVQALLKTH